MNKNRETGFYWVRKTTVWEVAEFYKFRPENESNGCWFIAGEEELYSDSDFEEIDERQIIRTI